MREIKFKAKRSDNKKWIYGDLVHDAFDGTSNHIPVGIKKKGWYPIEVLPETVCQFTGLKDKNEVDIYEKDTIKIPTLEVEYQTHVGNNIPNGSYTEPIGCDLVIYEHEVLFRNGSFCIEFENGTNPLEYVVDNFYDLDSAIDSVNVYVGTDLFDTNDSAAREDLKTISENHGFADVEDMINKITGVEITGNIHK